jgi:hypothetical protein
VTAVAAARGKAVFSCGQAPRARVASVRSATWGFSQMTDRRSVIMPVAAALGALTGTTPATDANAATPSNPVVEQPKAVPQTGQPNTLVSVGQDLLAFTINEQGDGSIVAQHVSHASHSSHSSHSSHVSSR